MKASQFLMVLTVLSFTSCKLFKGKSNDAPEVEVEDSEQVKDPSAVLEVNQPVTEDVVMAYGEICEALLASIRMENLDPMQPHFPDVNAARVMAPKEFGGKSDKEVTAVLDEMKSRFKGNLDNLISGAKENKVDVGSLSVKNCLYSKDSDLNIEVLTAEYLGGAITYEVALLMKTINGKTYVHEIPISTGIFEDRE